jgi:enoyl-CoA hydratase/long-chain 3-hydroxyacyl-CoA dehydrogenase
MKLNKALTDFGFPVGPITLADEVGIDVCSKVVKNVIGDQPKFLGVRMEGADLAMVQDMYEQGLHGRKTKKGFFDYSNPDNKAARSIHPEAKAILAKYRHATKDASALSPEELAERCVLRFVSEAVHCLQDGIIASASDGDIGAVFGIGFPPFLGGPFMWIDTLGAATVVEKMERLRSEHGEMFAPPQLLLDHAASGKPFRE